jgi:hypothetical protein
MLKALDNAQTALLKFEFDAASLVEKDWGDVIRWILPEAKVDFLLKDLNKRSNPGKTCNTATCVDNLHSL